MITKNKLNALKGYVCLWGVALHGFSVSAQSTPDAYIQSVRAPALRTLQHDIDLLKAQAKTWQQDDSAEALVSLPMAAVGKKSSSAHIKLLCEALEVRKFGSCEQTKQWDAQIEALVKSAQTFYGLDPDGLAQDQLLGSLRLKGSQKARLALLAASELEALQQKVARPENQKLVAVNVASFGLMALSGDDVQLTSKVIVGRPDRQTPLVGMNMFSIKYNPNWTPPPGIIKKDIYPSLDKDGSWLKKHGVIMTDKEGNVIDPEGVSSAEAKENGYRFTQPSGDSAALGVLKFETDSPENIYLHDTNERSLFKLSMRAKSSGCIRVQDFVKLASWVSESSEKEVQTKIDKKATVYQKIKKTPIHVYYSRAQVVEGKVVIYPDVYAAQKDPL